MKTTRVRILVAVDSRGEWASCGYSGALNLHKWIVKDELWSPFHYVWVEADVPVPDADTTVVGVATLEKESD